MINESNIVVLNFIKTSLCSLTWNYTKEFLLTFSKLQALRFYLIYFFELLDVEHGIPISHKNVKCNSLGFALAIDPTSPKGNFVHYASQILHYISHKMKYVSPLRVAALVGYIMLRT